MDSCKDETIGVKIETEYRWYFFFKFSKVQCSYVLVTTKNYEMSLLEKSEYV